MAKVLLGPDITAIRGKQGNAVLIGGATGTASRAYVVGTDPHTPAQTAMRMAMVRSAEAFRNLTDEQAQEWEAYAQTITKHDPVTLEAYHPTAYNVFNGLTMKFLQITPSGDIPTLPPDAPFVGDTITIEAHSREGVVLFVANGPNGEKTATELLVQRLPSPRRKPVSEKYRTQAFVSFVEAGETAKVEVGSGWWGVAYRFVNVATGQATQIVQLPRVQVF